MFKSSRYLVSSKSKRKVSLQSYKQKGENASFLVYDGMQDDNFIPLEEDEYDASWYQCKLDKAYSEQNAFKIIKVS